MSDGAPTPNGAPTLLEYLAARYRATAVRSHANKIDRYRRHIGERIEVAGYGEILDYIGVLRRRGLSARTLHHELAGVKIYYTWLCEAGARADHPCRTLRLADAVDRTAPPGRALRTHAARGAGRDPPGGPGAGRVPR